MAEENASGNVTHSYTWGPTGLISDRVGGVTRFYLYDAQGNTRTLMDASGNVLGRATYSSWGSVIYSTLPANCPFGWQGAEGAYTDPESGLVYLHNRYYAPGIGRFLTRDPSGFDGGINLYAYCGDDPINYGDPLGLDGDGSDPLAGAEDFDSDSQLYHREFNNFANSDEFQPGSPQRQDFSSGLHQIPYVGAALNTLDTLSGRDFVAGTKISAGGRLLGLFGMLPMASALRPAEEGGNEICALINGVKKNCFVAGTPIQMADGSTKPIEKVKTGDKVMSRDPQTGKTEAKPVVSTYVHQVDVTLTLTFSDGDQITSTPEHPYFVDGKGFVPAGQLAIGTSIITRAGPATQVKSISSRPSSVRVYNFTVADDHTYFVGTHDGGEWVHNRCPNDLHHIFPCKFRADWRRIGLAYNEYTVELAQNLHLSGIHGVGGQAFPNGLPGLTPGHYNDVWALWLRQHPNADIHDVINQGLEMMRNYGLDGLPIVPYR